MIYRCTLNGLVIPTNCTNKATETNASDLEGSEHLLSSTDFSSVSPCVMSEVWSIVTNPTDHKTLTNVMKQFEEQSAKMIPNEKYPSTVC